MSNESSDSASSSVFKNIVLGVAVVALLVVSWAYIQERNQSSIAQTEAANFATTLAKVEGELEAEKARPVTFEYARPVAGEDPRLFVQVQAGKKIRFYNRTDGDDLKVTYEANAFPELSGNPIEVSPNDHLDLTLNPMSNDGYVYWVLVDEPLKHGGADMIVGSGP